MIRELFLVLVIGVIVNGYRTTIARRNRTRTTTISYNYINNWQDYKMPEKIKTEKLKEVLGEIAKFKRLEFCPMEDEKACEKSDYKSIVSEIILKAVENETDEAVPDAKAERNGPNVDIKEILFKDLNFFTWLLSSKKTKSKTVVEIKATEIDESRNSEEMKKKKVSVKPDQSENHDSEEDKKNEVSVKPQGSQNSTANDELKPRAIMNLKYLIYK